VRQARRPALGYESSEDRPPTFRRRGPFPFGAIARMVAGMNQILLIADTVMIAVVLILILVRR
jgi:hypothetical protein